MHPQYFLFISRMPVLLMIKHHLKNLMSCTFFSCVFEQAEKNVYLEERLQVLQQQNEDLKERIDKNVAVSRSDKFKRTVLKPPCLCKLLQHDLVIF